MSKISNPEIWTIGELGTMSEHDWIINILEDIRDYAEINGLTDIAQDFSAFSQDTREKMRRNVLSSSNVINVHFGDGELRGRMNTCLGLLTF